MIRHRTAAVLLALLALTACSDDEPAGAPWVDGSPAPAAAESAAAVGPLGVDSAPPKKPEIATNPDGTRNSAGPRPATRETTLNAGGLGPYRIGISRTELDEAGLVTDAKPDREDNCADYVTAKGTGRYQSPALTFYRGKLLRLTLAGSAATDQGVKVGTPLADVRKSYPAGTQLDDWTGRPAWLAETGAYGLLFEMTDGKVSAIQAGMAEPMRFRYTDNQGC